MSLTTQVYAEPLNGRSTHPERRCRRKQHNAASDVTANKAPIGHGGQMPSQINTHIGVAVVVAPSPRTR